MALSKDATRHVHQKSKKLAQNPTVPKEQQDPIRRQRSLHIWHMLFCSNFYSTKITNKLNSRVQLQYLSSYCNHSQIFLNYSKYKRACKMNRKIKKFSYVLTVYICVYVSPSNLRWYSRLSRKGIDCTTFSSNPHALKRDFLLIVYE